MNLWLISGVTVAYVLTSAGFFYTGKIGPGIVFTGYSIANLGFIYDLI